jgi:hypothetical protein
MRPGALALVSCSMVLAMAAPASAADLGLVVLGVPGGAPRGSFEMAVEPGATETAIPIYVRQADGKAVAKLRLAADIVGATVELKPDSGAAGAEVDLAGNGFLRYTLTAKDVKKRTVKGKIIATAGKDAQTLADLTVTRPPNAQTLAIDGAGDDGIARTSDTPDVRLALGIVSMQRDDVDDLRVAVGPFASETTVEVRPEVQIDGRPLDATKRYKIEGNTVLPLDISVRLDAGGVHKSMICLTYGGQTSVVPVQITRDRVAPTVVFDEVLEQRHSLSPFKATDITLNVPVTENGGRTVELQRPSLTLKRVDGDATELARYDRYTVDERDAGATTLTPGQSHVLKVTIFGLKGAGEYSALLRFRGAGGDPKDVSTKLWIRVPWQLALLVLAAAVCAGEIVRRLRTERLVSMRAQTELALVNDQLERASRDTDATAEEQPVLQVLRDWIAELYNRVGRKPDADIAAERTELDTKVALVSRWLAAARDARNAGWPGDSRVKLRTVGEFLTTRGAADAIAPRAALQEVEALLSAGPDLKTALEELDRAVRGWLPESRALPAEKKAVTDALSEAKAKLARGLVAEAEEAYDVAAAKLAEAAAAELLALVTATSPPPGVAPPAWAALREELQAASAEVASADRPNAAVAIFRKAHARYLAVVSKGLQSEVRSRHEAAALAQERGDEAARPDDFKPALDSLDAAVQKATDERDLAGARADYESARTKIDTLRRAGKMGAASRAPEMAAAIPEIPTRAAEAGPRPAVLIPTGAAADARRRTVETLLALFAALVAAASGLVLLYFPDPAWGSVEDFFVAALWGAGVHTVANATFQSVPTVLGKLGTGTP